MLSRSERMINCAGRRYQYDSCSKHRKCCAQWNKISIYDHVVGSRRFQVLVSKAYLPGMF